MSELFSFCNKDGIDLKARVYPLTSDKPAILYFHGGGLLFGDKDDLPKEYIQQFLDAGHPFIAFDYRLAPEAALPELYTDVQDAVKWFHTNFKEIGLAHNRFIYFGRSAGAFLTFLAVKDASLPKPDKMISFYGYSRLDIEEFSGKAYQQISPIPKMLVDRLIENKPVVVGPIQKRFALYIYARQNGTWISELFKGSAASMDQYQLSDSDLQALPPVFIAQSRMDQDVPFHAGQLLHKSIPNNEFYIVDKGEHDFDRDPANEFAMEAYEKVIAFCAK